MCGRDSLLLLIRSVPRQIRPRLKQPVAPAHTVNGEADLVAKPVSGAPTRKRCQTQKTRSIQLRLLVVGPICAPLSHTHLIQKKFNCQLQFALSVYLCNSTTMFPHLLSSSFYPITISESLTLSSFLNLHFPFFILFLFYCIIYLPSCAALFSVYFVIPSHLSKENCLTLLYSNTWPT